MFRPQPVISCHLETSNPPSPPFAKGGKVLESPFGKGGFREIFGWRLINIFAALFIGLMASHCTMPQILHPVLEPEDFHEEIARLEAAAVEALDLYEITEVHLQLALLYSHYKNPATDYLKALKELELYTALAPESEKTADIQSLFAVLRELKKLTDENKQVKRKMEEMNLKIQQLARENQELKETVEELKHLDLNIEERRREVK